LAFLSSLDATARSFRGAAPILHRADQNDPKNETVGLLKLLEQLGLVGRGNPRAGIADRDGERPVG
jgi:hypothetical protein